jgi:hypothetical protein
MCLHDNVFNVLLEHMQKIGMNSMIIEYPNKLLKHCN